MRKVLLSFHKRLLSFTYSSLRPLLALLQYPVHWPIERPVQNSNHDHHHEHMQKQCAVWYQLNRTLGKGKNHGHRFTFQEKHQTLVQEKLASLACTLQNRQPTRSELFE